MTNITFLIPENYLKRPIIPALPPSIPIGTTRQLAPETLQGFNRWPVLQSSTGTTVILLDEVTQFSTTADRDICKLPRRIERSCNLQSSQDWNGFFFSISCPVWCHFAVLSQHAVWLICVIWPTQRSL